MVNKTYQRFLRRRLINIGVKPDIAAEVSSRFQHQINHMGLEGACAYFKRVGDQLSNYLFGTGEPSKWVAKTKSGFPKFLIELKDYSLEILIRISKFARVIRLDSPSAKQVDKVVSAVLKPYGGSQDALERVTELIIRGARHYNFDLLGDFPKQSSDRLVNHYTDTMTVSANSDWLTGTKVPPLLDSLSIVRNVPVLQVTNFESVFWPILPQSVHDLLSSEEAKSAVSQFVGEIHATQEGGCKLRMFAAPYTIVQCILSPIHDFVASARKRIPTDYTYSQLDGALVVQQHLKLGTVWSFDLTTATCRFPLLPQLRLLSFMGVPKDYLDALHWACRGDWKVGSEISKSFGHNSLAWVTGQPLGLRPSMSMFSTAHNCLLAGIAIEVGSDPESSFAVLGDDVSIFDARVADLYRTVLHEMDVPISLQKSHISDRVAEFAGATITKSCIIRPGQWRQLDFFNAVSVAVDLKTPLVGEVTNKVLLCQKLALFDEGLYDPSSSEWSWYVKANSMLKSSIPDLSQVPNVPTLLDGAFELFNEILLKAYPKVSVLYEQYQEDFITAAFQPMVDFGLDVSYLTDFARSAHRDLYHFEYYPPSRDADDAINFATSHLLTEWELGNLDYPDVQRLDKAIRASVLSLLFVPPKFKSPYRLLREQIERLFRAVDVLIDPTDIYEYPIYIRSNSNDMIPSSIVEFFLHRQREHESMFT